MANPSSVRVSATTVGIVTVALAGMYLLWRPADGGNAVWIRPLLMVFVGYIGFYHLAGLLGAAIGWVLRPRYVEDQEAPGDPPAGG